MEKPVLAHRPTRPAWLWLVLIASTFLAVPALAQTPRFRPGIFAPGLYDPYGREISRELAGAQAVRFIIDHSHLATIIRDPESLACQSFADMLREYRKEDGKEVIVTIRIPHPTLSHYDHVPPYRGARGQARILKDIAVFFRAYSDCIDYYQVANEVFGGPGTYWIGSETSGYPITQSENDGDLTYVFNWFERLASAAKIGDPDIKVLSPALFGAMIDGAVDGHEPTIERVNRTVDFGNAHDGVDIHLRTETIEEMLNTIDQLVDPSTPFRKPERVTCLEWSARATVEWRIENEDVLRAMYLSPVSPEEWDRFVREDWLAAQGVDMDHFAELALARMAETGFMHACYGNMYQVGVADPLDDPLSEWTLVATYANETALPFDWCPTIRNAFEAAALQHPPVVWSHAAECCPTFLPHCDCE